MVRELFIKNIVVFELFTLLSAASLSSSCNKSEFGTGGGRFGRSTITATSTRTGTGFSSDADLGAGRNGDADVDDAKGGVPDSATSGAYKDTITREVELASFESFWTVTMQGVVTHYKLNGKKIDGMKRWTFSIPSNGIGGARTYVTEGGLVFAKPRGHLYWVDPEATPEGALPEDTHHYFYPELDTEGGALGRACVVSYKRSGTRYIGAGFGPGNFIEIKLADKYPYEPIWTDYKIIRPATPGSEWGYSCFIDQKKMIYYGKTVGGMPQALSLQDGMSLRPAATVAPNGGFVSGNPELQRFMYDSIGGGSYVLAGGVNGQVFNVQGAYAFSDDKHGTIWGSFLDGNRMFVSKSNCLIDNTPCQRGVDFVEQPLMMGGVGPLSALKSGNLIGLRRGSGEIYYLTLVDRADLTKGIETTQIGSTEGDPYMYTDFTGSTLYESSFQDYRVILSESNKFEPTLAIAKLKLTTIPNDGDTLDWTGYELHVRCRHSNGDATGEFEPLPDAAQTVNGAVVGVSMCQGAVINEVQIRIKKIDENAQPLRIKAIGISFEQ